MAIPIHPRDEVWPGEVPTSSNGAPRPLLRPDRIWLTVHYTGVPVRWLDEDDTPDELRAIQRYAQGAGKSWEYNFVIDGQGQIWTYAGDYRAAHSAGENEAAYGVLLLVGTDEPPTEPMVLAVRQLRWLLLSTGRLAPSHEVRKHLDMPGANTSCPGALVIARWDEITTPWEPTLHPEVVPPEPEPVLTRSVSMIRIDHEFGTPNWCALLFADRVITHISNGHTADMLDAGLVPTVVRSTEQLVGILGDRSVRAVGVCPFPNPSPELRAAWDAAALRL